MQSQCTDVCCQILALCLCLFRKGFPAVVGILDRVVANMAAQHRQPGAELDINNVTLRLALDITGEVSVHAGLATLEAWVCARPARQLL